MNAREGETRAGIDRAGIAIAFLLLALGAVVAWDAFNIRSTGAAYSGIGPKAFPYGIAAGLTILGIATFVAAMRGGARERPPAHWPAMIWIVAGLLAQIALLPLAGFSIATGAVFAATAYAFGRGPLWITYPLGVAFCLAIWLVFDRGLKLVLPTGILERLF